MKRALVLLPAILFGLAACSDGGAPAPPPEPRRGEVFDPLIQTLERARGVEDTLRERGEERDRRSREAGGRDR
jgi:hypothetical protein